MLRYVEPLSDARTMLLGPSVSSPLTQTVQGGGGAAAIPTLGTLALALLAAGLAAIGARLASH